MWIAVDWGTSNMRAWVFGDDGALIHEARSDRGMASLSPDEFEPTLLALVSDYLPEARSVPVICCGMVGARQGWTEAAYAKVPCPPPDLATATKPKTNDPRLDVYILPGVSQDSPADVMRGEETQIAGYLAQDPEFDGILCLPGTHTKWVHISAGEIVSFRSYMTGELFALLSDKSVLRHSTATDGWDQDAFLKGVDMSMGRPQALAAELFTIRADDLLHGTTKPASRARLSGLLMGMELAAARPYWLGQNVVIIGAEALAALYQSSLETLSAMVTTTDATNITRAGLRAAFETGQLTT